MKRFLFAMILMALVAPAVVSAATQKHQVDLKWRQSRAAFPGGGFRDSLMARANGSASPTAHDTTAAVSLLDFVLPEKGAGQLPTASDSISWLRFDFFAPEAAPTVAADSINLTIEVSSDGDTWVKATPTSVFLTTSDSEVGAVVLEQGSSNTFYAVVRQRVGAVASGDLFFPIRSSSTAPTWQELYGWSYIRFIVQSDATGQFDAKLTGFIPVK